MAIASATLAGRKTRCWIEGSPVTAAYVALLLSTHWIVDHALSRSEAAGALLYVSTNLDNLQHHPVQSLIGSALFMDVTLTNVMSLSFVGTLITLVGGICVALSLLERRWGALRAYTIFALGHVGATLIAALVIVLALKRGWYPASVRDTYDYGISYGAQAVLAYATVTLVPRRLRVVRVLCCVSIVAWPFGGMTWMSILPDFTTLGHLFAATIGFLSAWRFRGRHREPSEATVRLE